MGRHLRDMSAVYHCWAHQTQQEGIASHSSFSGRDAYSYGAIIGRILTSPNDEWVYVLSTEKFSTTTSCHQSNCQGAVPLDARKFFVSTLRNDDTPESILVTLADEIGVLLEKASAAKRRKTRAELQMQAIHRYIDVTQFAQCFGLQLPEGLTFVVEGIDFFDPETHRTYLTQFLETFQEDRKRKEEEADRRREQAEALKLEQWMSGTDNLVWSFQLRYQRMRVNGDQVETTMGLSVPLDDVRRAKPYVLAAMEKVIAMGEEYIPPADSRLAFGYYRLSRIESDGTVIVGCHRFRPEEIRRFAALI